MTYYSPIIQLTLIWLAVCACKQQDSSLTEIETIRTLLSARDGSLTSLYVPYKAYAQLPTGEISSAFEGYWCQRGKHQAISVEHSTVLQSALQDWLNGKGTFTTKLTWRGHWDGSIGKALQIQPGLPTRLTISRVRGSPFVLFAPPNYGWLNTYSPWTNYLSSNPAKAQVLGYEEVLGRRCARILIDPLAATVEDVRKPQMIWVDISETFLVLRNIHFAPIENVGKQVEKNAVSIRGKHFIPTLILEAMEVARVGRHWFPIRAESRFASHPEYAKTTVVVEASSIQIDQPVGDDLIEVVPPPDAFVEDLILGKTYYVGTPSNVKGAIELQFEKDLKEIANVAHLNPSPVSQESQNLLAVPCGIRSLYAWLRLNGIISSLGQLQFALPSPLTSVSLKDLQDVARDLGLEVEAVSVPSKDASALKGVFIAHMQGKSTGSHEADDPAQTHHFAIARWTNQGVIILNIPGGLSSLDQNEFAKHWTGYALVRKVSSAQPQTGAIPTGESTPGWWVVGVGVLALLVCVTFVLWRNIARRARVPRNLLMCLFGVLVLSNCKKRAIDDRAASDSCVEVMGASTMDFGTVNEGDLLNLEFWLRNKSTSPILLTSVQSCGCTSIAFSSPSPAPGQTVSVKANIITLGRSGGFQEFMDIIANGKRSATVWMVGKVNPVVRISSDPHSLDLGVLRPGSRVSQDLTVVTETHIDKGPIRIEVLPDSTPNSYNIQFVEVSEFPGEEDKGTQRVRRGVRGRLDIVVNNKIDSINVQAVAIFAIDRNGKKVAAIGLPITAEVAACFLIQPKSLFIGCISSGESTDMKMRLVPVIAVNSNPRFSLSANWLTIERIERLKDHVEITIRATPTSSISAGLVKESVQIQWENESRVIHVIGMIRR